MTRPDRDVLLCRDCCCGSGSKHPRTDHGAQREALLACSGVDGVRVRVVDCLSHCDRSNVVLVRDFTAGRRPHDTWLGGVLDATATEQVVAWVTAGDTLPAELSSHCFRQVARG